MRGQSKGNGIYISTLKIFIKIKIFNLKEYMFIFFICRWCQLTLYHMSLISLISLLISAPKLLLHSTFILHVLFYSDDLKKYYVPCDFYWYSMSSTSKDQKQDLHITESMQYLCFCVQITSLSILLSVLASQFQIAQYNFSLQVNKISWHICTTFSLPFTSAQTPRMI